MPQQTFESPHQQAILTSDYLAYCMELKRPNPPTPEAIEKAQFKDKTYRWNGR
tara:strand:- start:809 stop:967 length:159 start_codon:yes stop_codon:yes gene_type:complete